MVALQDPHQQAGCPLEYPQHRWVCPTTGTVVAMDPRGNAEQRAKVVRLCKDNVAEQKRIFGLCRQSFLLWLNLFGFTYVVYEVQETGERLAKLDEKDRPFIAWPTQEVGIDRLTAARAKGRDLVIPKSREMGATWLILAWMAWMALFHGSPMGVASRKGDLVDKSGDPDALFTKIDYLVKWMPTWMVGELVRTSMHIGFVRSGGTIDGESTNKHAFRGGRKHAIMFDEAAAMENLAAIVRASKDSGIRIFISTHEEVSHFLELTTSGRADVYHLAWWDHPDKGYQREQVFDAKTGQVQWTSPWYRLQLLERDPKDIALNIDMRPGGDGSMVFDLSTLITQESMYGCDPYLMGRVGLEEGYEIQEGVRPHRWPLDHLEFKEQIGALDLDGVLQLWCDLVPDLDGRRRPDQQHGYAFGVDVGDGVGATPSVISIVDVDNGYKIGKWVSRHTRPENLGMFLYQLGFWFGGTQRAPLIVVEANGGRAVGILIDLQRWHYPRIYRHKELTKVGAEKSEVLGWVSTQPRKKAQLATYGGSLFRGEFKNPDIPAVHQCRQYVHIRDEMGRGSRVAPKALGHLSDGDLAEHGDEVISDMLADLGRIRSPLIKAEETTPAKNTVAWFQQQRKQDERKIWAP